MGEGLHHDPDGLTVFAEPLDGLGDDVDDDERLALWAEFERDVLACLSDSWSLTRRWKRRARVLAANGFYELTLTEDSYGRAHITVAVRTDLDAKSEALARATVTTAAEGVFTRLARLHPLRQRATPWTSRPWTPPDSRAAESGRGGRRAA
jgi:hypothetical protein